MAKKKKVKKKARRMVTFGVASFLLIILISITLFSVFTEILDKYKEKNELENKIIALEEKENELENQLIALEEKEKELENDVKKLEDPEYLARYAREKYFYSKDGELIIRIPEDE